MIEYNDYELVELAQEGNEEAINLIYQKYKPIIIKKSENAIFYATHHGIEIDDIIQEGFIALDDAINNFYQGDNASFYTFATLCIERKIVNYLRKTTRGKNRILNEAIYIDENIESITRDKVNVEDDFIYKNENLQIIEKIKGILTEFELKVFNWWIKGYTFYEIANILDKDVKSIYNTFQRIKVKVKKGINKDD